MMLAHWKYQPHIKTTCPASSSNDTHTGHCSTSIVDSMAGHGFCATWRLTSASSDVHIEPEANERMELSHEFLKKTENPNVFDLEATTHDTEVP